MAEGGQKDWEGRMKIEKGKGEFKNTQYVEATDHRVLPQTSSRQRRITSSKMGNTFTGHEQARGTQKQLSTSRASTEEQLEKADAEMKKTKNENKLLKTQLTKLKNRVENLESKSSFLQITSSKMDNTYTGHEQARGTEKQLSTSRSSTEEQLEEADAEMKRTKNENKLKTQLTKLKNRVEDLEAKNSFLQNENKHTKKQLEVTEKDCLNQKDRLDAAQQNYRNLEAKLKAVHKTAVNAQDHYRKLEDTLDAAHKTLEKTQLNYRTLEASLNTAHMMVEKTQDAYHNLRAKTKQDYCQPKADLDTTHKSGELTHKESPNWKSGLDPTQKAAVVTHQDCHQPKANLDTAITTQVFMKTNLEDKMNATHDTAENAQNDYAKLEGSFETAHETLEKTRQVCHTLGGRLDATQKALENAQRDYEHVACQNGTVIDILLSSNTALRIDKRMTENISERCRPSVIAKKYHTLENQEWLDAKEALQGVTQMNEEEINRFLCEALMATYETSRDMYQSLVTAVSALIHQPYLAIDMRKEDMGSITTQLPDEFLDAILTRLRQYCNWDFGEVLKILDRKFKDYADLFHIDAVEKYLHASAQLTWQMAIQQPPMKMSVTGGRFDENRHRMWYECKRARVYNISHFVWPVLYDCEGGNLMIKGCVVTY